MSITFIFHRVRHDFDVYESNPIFIPNKGPWIELTPYFSLTHNSADSPDLNIHVGFKLCEGVYDEGSSAFTRKKYTKDTTKQYELHTEAVYHFVNIEAAIVEAYLGQNKQFDSLTVEYDWNKRYLRLQNIDEKIKDYLSQWKVLHISEDVATLAQKIASLKLMADFKRELESSLDKNEAFISNLLKKYESLLPLVLLGVDSTLSFEYSFQGQDLEENRADALIDKNIVELKQPSAELFDKRSPYRNNTYSPTKEFSSAIQQTNVQRAHYSQSHNEKLSPLCKSILLIGNAKKEFNGYADKEILEYNLAVIKFNNKDITIMTYDDVLERIDSFLLAHNTAES